MRLLGWFFSSLLFLLVVAGAVGFAMLQSLSNDLPDYRQLANYEPPITTRIYAADGHLIAEYATENRLFVPIEQIPDHVIQAFVSAEDQHFWTHPGIDITGIARAVVQNLQALGTGRRPVGASTITQQVAKNFLLSSDVSFERKIREALLAFRIERAFSKEQILELYLNEIYLGRNAYGVAAAALNYFNKPLTELTLAEAAYLAALPKAPNNYHPVRRHDAAVARRNYVINRMLADGAITPEEAAEAREAPLEVTDRTATDFARADYFAEEVRRELQRVYGDDALYRGGLSVRASVDPHLQNLADRALRDGLTAYDRRHGWRGPVTRLPDFDNWPLQLSQLPRPAGAGTWQLAVVLDVDNDKAVLGFADRNRGVLTFEEMRWARPWRPAQRVGPEPQRAVDVLELGDVVLVSPTGGSQAAVVATSENPQGERLDLPTYSLQQIPDVQGALVAMDPHTGRVLAMAGGYDFEMSEFNRVTQAMRQPGSAFKPFIYLAALDQGYTPSSIIDDSPLEIFIPGQPMYRPTNYSGDFLGPTTIRVGIERSRNVMTVRLLQDIGLETAREVSSRFGIMDNMPLLYSMALGAGETTALRLTAAYAVLVNGGYQIEPTFVDRIQDRTGRIVYRHDQRGCENCRDTVWSGQEAPELPDERAQIADPVTAYQMVSMMEGVVQRGTAARLRSLGFPVAGKTGTSNNVHDTWFVGFTPDMVVGVFVGFDQPRTLGPRETGGSVAAPIFGDFMAAAMEDRQVPPFRIPPEVSLVRVDPATGRQASSGGNAIWEAFRPGTEPGTMSAEQFETDTGVGSGGSGGSSTGGGTGGLY